MSTLDPSSSTLAALASACAFSGLGLPWPEDLPLMLAGWGLRRGELPLLPTLLVSLGSVFFRDGLAFTLGHLVRLGLAGRRLSRWLERRGLAIEGPWRLLVMARLLVGLRVPLFASAGLAGASPRRFLLVEVLGLPLLVPLALWLGWRWGEDAAAAFRRAQAARWPVLLLGLLALLLVASWAWRRRRGAARS